MLINEFIVEHNPGHAITVEGKFSINNPLEIKIFSDIANNTRSIFGGPTIQLEDICNFRIEKVIFNNPATIVLWKDGTKTVVKCSDGDTYDKEKGLALCFMKKALGNKGNFNNVLKEHTK